MSKWISKAGPRQTKAVETALRSLRAHGGKRVEISGVIGETERRAVIWQYGAELLPAVVDALALLGARFGWTITADNYREVAAAAEEYEKSIPLPEVDCRIAPEVKRAQESAAADRAAADRLARDERIRLHEQLDALPAKRDNSGCWIVASLDENQSDFQTDYFAHRSTRHVVIGWRTGSREDFRQLRAAAARFPETAHMGPGCDVWTITVPTPFPTDGYRPARERLGADGKSGSWPAADFTTEAGAREFAALHGFADTAEFHCESVEHRETWSMGGGNYLKAGSRHSSTWSVRSCHGVHLPSGPVEIAAHLLAPTADPIAPPADDTAPAPAPAADGAPTWRENAEKGGVEIRFPSRPAARILERLKDHGFRWSRFAGCWWHKKTEMSVAVCVAICAELAPELASAE